MRDASTYRGARRNRCIRLERCMWGPEWYYDSHRNNPRWAIAAGKAPPNNQSPIYMPRQAREGRKPATTSNAVHALLRRGDYAGAVRQFFSRKGKASGRGD